MHTLKKIVPFVFLLLVQAKIAQAQEQKAMASLNEVLLLAKEKNTAFKNEVLQLNLANITRKAAIGNVFNPRVPSSIQMIDNINQQVSFLPGQAFGLPAGTFKEVTIGQQYVSTFNVMPQFDILNFGTITQLKSSKLNKELVVNEQKIAEQKVYDQLNAIYFNILSFEAQKNTVTENVAIAQKIATIVKNKFDEGVARKQELNEAEVN
ncbi:MAG: TolC family protein, partial [Bacteroidia bacterium]